MNIFFVLHNIWNHFADYPPWKLSIYFLVFLSSVVNFMTKNVSLFVTIIFYMKRLDGFRKRKIRYYANNKKVILQTKLTTKVIPIAVTFKYQSLKRHEVTRKWCALSICCLLQIVTPSLCCASTSSFKFVHIFYKKSVQNWFFAVRM